MQHKVIIVDDHLLFARALETLINNFTNYEVVFRANNGAALIKYLETNPEHTADIILLDINMPVMNGLETLQWLNKNKIQSKVIALSMMDEDHLVIKMLKEGAKSYLLKDISPDELLDALNNVVDKGQYYNQKVTATLMNSFVKESTHDYELKQRELQFLELACTEMTYKEIADKMNLSPKTIDGYREALFIKLNVKSRTGMVLYAIKHKLFGI